MALMRGKLFAGALFAGVLFSHGEQVPVTPQIPLAGGGIYREIPYAKAPVKHVKLSGKTWQEQDTYGYAGIKYDLAAQHKVFALGKTEQEQEASGSINLVAKQTSFAQTFKPQVAQKISTLVSAYSLPDIATAQIHVSRGTITISVPVAQDTLVSTHSLANASTAQIQKTHGKISIKGLPHIAVKTLATYQQQSMSGKITTDDDEMLMALLALIELDEGEDYAIS